eukprot:1961025-Alexandrium_andersonii.AAC.1
MEWLKFSSHTSLEGRSLQQWCSPLGFVECVRQPTRELHLLDLVLSDCAEILEVSVLPELADHRLVLVHVAAPGCSFH